jgi:hypothetical protein
MCVPTSTLSFEFDRPKSLAALASAVLPFAVAGYVHPTRLTGLHFLRERRARCDATIEVERINIEIERRL